MITFENVNKEYWLKRNHTIAALKNINFNVNEGEFVSIIGPSGSGKSTFLALASLLDKQTTGEIVINGIQTSQLNDRERTNLRYELCGFIFQFASLMPALSVIDNVMLPMLLRGEKSDFFKKKAMEILMQVGLKKEQANHLPYQLSGGEQRRVAVARALLKEPPLLFADEPTSALDEDTAKDLIELFHQINHRGTTIIMVTHDKELAKEGTGIFEIRNGSLKSFSGTNV